MCGSTNENPICVLYSSAFIVSARYPCWPPLIFDATDAVFPPTNKFILISPSFVGSIPIFRRVGVGKYAINPLALLVAPEISAHTFVGIDGRIVLWDSLSNPLKDICRLTIFHWRVDFNGLLDKFMSTLGCYG